MIIIIKVKLYINPPKQQFPSFRESDGRVKVYYKDRYVWANS